MQVFAVNGGTRLPVEAGEGETLTVGQVLDQVGSTLNIVSTATALVNGEEVDADYELADGDEVTFNRVLGQKG